MRRPLPALLAALALWAWAAPAAPAGEGPAGPLGAVGNPGAAGAGSPAEGEPFEFAVIFVNGRAITTSYMTLLTAADYRRFDRVREDGRRAGAWNARAEADWNAARQRVWRQALSPVVFGELLRTEAEVIRKLGFDVTDRQVEERWRQMLKDAGGPAELARVQGLSVAALKELARDELLADAYRYTLRQQLAKPTPEELRQYFRKNAEGFSRPESVKARAVVIRRFLDGEGGAPAARRGAEPRAREVLQQAQAKGADFAKLAAKYSEDPVSAARGGTLGEAKKDFLVERGAYEPELEKVLFGAAPGGAPVLVAGPANYYVVQVLKHCEAGVPPFEDVADEVMRRCLDERVRQTEERFFRETYHKALVLGRQGQRLSVKDFLAEVAGPRKRSLFDQEEPEEAPQSPKSLFEP